jgi:SAM-dependent methyltransferase
MADPQAPAPIVADDFDDNDSALGDDTPDVASSTASINSSIMRYREENGRTYHAYKDGKYLGPNDEREMDRLDLQHHLFTLTLDGRLFTCPVEKEGQIHRVLDVGTGTGIWSIDFGDDHPEAQVLGIDLSPIQPSFLPPNVSFQVDDLEEPWTFREKFDFIYSRMMTASFADWPRFFEQCFE